MRVVVPPLPCRAADGHGGPSTAPAYAAALEALYGGACTLKSAVKKAPGRDFVAAPLGGLRRTMPRRSAAATKRRGRGPC